MLTTIDLLPLLLIVFNQEVIGDPVSPTLHQLHLLMMIGIEIHFLLLHMLKPLLMSMTIILLTQTVGHTLLTHMIGHTLQMWVVTVHMLPMECALLDKNNRGEDLQIQE